ncbi:hypothetical protein MTO96_017455 [Rhipicephalus appendiculatus]
MSLSSHRNFGQSSGPQATRSARVCQVRVEQTLGGGNCAGVQRCSEDQSNSTGLRTSRKLRAQLRGSRARAPAAGYAPPRGASVSGAAHHAPTARPLRGAPVHLCDGHGAVAKHGWYRLSAAR